MMYELFLKELANYELNQIYHANEKQKGFDVEYHEKSENESNIRWNTTRIIAKKILGCEMSMKCSIEARKLAVSEFEKGHIYIEALENNAEL